MAGDIQIPKWLKGFIDENGAREIQYRVEEAEKQTQAEIVPMIVRSSSTKGLLPLVIFLIFSVVIIGFVHHVYLLFAFVALSVPFAFLSAQLPFVQRLMIPKRDQILDVYHRAHYEFFEKKLSHTDSQTGVLIFVSLNEHRCVILADEKISSRVQPDTWNDAVQVLLKGIKEKNAAKGFMDAIDLCKNILSEEFPAKDRNQNELHNHLIIEE